MRNAPVASLHAVSGRSFVVGLLTLVGLVLGLLTMHSMGAGPAVAADSTAVHAGISGQAHTVETSARAASSASALLQPGTGEAAPLAECDEMCQAEMGGLLCALGLLAAGVAAAMWLGRLNAARRDPLTWRTLPRAVLFVAAPRPPSLTELSISRT